jgi:hypothetical protein
MEKPTKDTPTKEQLLAALQEMNITDLDSLAEFMINKRASLKTVEEDLQGGATTQGSFIGRNYIMSGSIKEKE